MLETKAYQRKYDNTLLHNGYTEGLFRRAVLVTHANPTADTFRASPRLVHFSAVLKPAELQRMGGIYVSARNKYMRDSLPADVLDVALRHKMSAEDLEIAALAASGDSRVTTPELRQEFRKALGDRQKMQAAKEIFDEQMRDFSPKSAEAALERLREGYTEPS